MKTDARSERSFSLLLCQILLVVVKARRQLLPTKPEEIRLNNIVWISGKRDFGPEDLQELAVAFENCCAAMPETKSHDFREQLALRLINWAALGMAVDGTGLYMRALHDYRALQRL